VEWYLLFYILIEKKQRAMTAAIKYIRNLTHVSVIFLERPNENGLKKNKIEEKKNYMWKRTFDAINNNKLK